MKYSLGISNFLEEISSLSQSIVFLYLFALITEEGFLISPSYSLELCIHMGMYLVTQSCPTLCDPMNRTLPGSSVHGILQARILEWVAISFSKNGDIFPFLLCLSLHFLSQLCVRPPQTTILPFCISFSWGWF